MTRLAGARVWRQTQSVCCGKKDWRPGGDLQAELMNLTCFYKLVSALYWVKQPPGLFAIVYTNKPWMFSVLLPCCSPKASRISVGWKILKDKQNSLFLHKNTCDSLLCRTAPYIVTTYAIFFFPELCLTMTGRGTAVCRARAWASPTATSSMSSTPLMTSGGRRGWSRLMGKASRLASFPARKGTPTFSVFWGGGGGSINSQSVHLCVLFLLFIRVEKKERARLKTVKFHARTGMIESNRVSAAAAAQQQQQLLLPPDAFMAAAGETTRSPSDWGGRDPPLLAGREHRADKLKHKLHCRSAAQLK